MYLEKRRRKWYAVHDIPPSVREALGGRKRFIKSLQTQDHATAKRRALGWYRQWLKEIEHAQGSPSDPLDDALYWRSFLEKAEGDEREILEEQLINRIDDRLYDLAKTRGWEGDPRDQPDAEHIHKFYQIATGKLVATDDHIDDWLSTKAHLQDGTIRTYRHDLGLLSERFPYLADITKAEVTKWITGELTGQQQLSSKTITRMLAAFRGYWQYLQDMDKVPADQEPFTRLSVQRSAKASRPRSIRDQFSPEQVHRLLKEALERGDAPMVDLITLGMWTGGRIEELCSVTIQEVHLDAPVPHLEIGRSKTAAGIRKVPVHSKLLEEAQRMVDQSADGYLIQGLTADKHGDRSRTVGRRFSSMKTRLGFGKEHAFHSFRHTVVTRLLNAGVSPHDVGGLVGHESGGSVTLGVYHKGADLRVLKEAIEKLDYPQDSS
jgi:integrase